MVDRAVEWYFVCGSQGCVALLVIQCHFKMAQLKAERRMFIRCIRPLAGFFSEIFNTILFGLIKPAVSMAIA
jgi:hypothetical protein